MTTDLLNASGACTLKHPHNGPHKPSEKFKASTLEKFSEESSHE